MISRFAKEGLELAIVVEAGLETGLTSRRDSRCRAIWPACYIPSDQRSDYRKQEAYRDDCRPGCLRIRQEHCAQTIRMKLGGSGSLADKFPDRPKGMHWRTYYQLKEEAGDAEQCCWSPWVLKMLASR